MRAALDRLIAGASIDSPSDVSDEDRQRLAALGYVGSGPGVAPDTPGETLSDPKDKVPVLEVYRRASELSGQRRYLEAIPLYRQILHDDPGMADVWLQLAQVLTRTADYEEAAEAYQKAIAINPGDPGALIGASAMLLDEDAIDILCPGSLYPRVFTEGVFGIVPTGLDSFECTPWLPKAWPRMALRDLRAFGQSWDLVVERAGDQEKVTVRSGGKTVMTGRGPAGKTYSLTFPVGRKSPSIR